MLDVPDGVEAIEAPIGKALSNSSHSLKTMLNMRLNRRGIRYAGICEQRLLFAGNPNETSNA